MYEVSTNIMKDIKDEFIRELDNRGYSYSCSAIDIIFTEWYNQKQGLLSLLSKHPNWNPERLMIHFEADYSRRLDTTTTKGFIYWIDNNFDSVVLDAESAQVWHKCYDFMLCYCSTETYLPEINDKTFGKYDEYGRYVSYTVNPLDELNTLLPELHARTGQKNTKIVGKICSHFGIDKIKKYGTAIDHETGEVKENVLIDSYDRQFAKFCDALSPIKVTRHTCISLNPVDYLLMSNGNSWRSCHYIGDDASDSGCYSSGTISYMLDQHSIIFYTVDADFNGVCIESAPKISRQVFGYNDFQLLQSRLYPQNNDIGARDTYTDIRNIMQKVVADCLAAPNRWIKKRVQNVVHGYGATCYPDWDCQSNLCSTSILRGKENDDLEPIELGATPICIECGYTHNCEESINCCNNHKYICEYCGNGIDEDEVCWIGDHPYCNDCVTYCECCGEYELNDEATWIESEDRYVCRDCLDRYYLYCDDCGEYYDRDRMNYLENLDKCVCNDCFEDYTQCNECNRWFYYTEINEDCLCEDCAAKMKEEEEEDNE